VVIDHTFGNIENLEVIVRNLPPNTDFVLFVISAPTAPFGLAWYDGDILTDDTGTGVINVVGRFNRRASYRMVPGSPPSGRARSRKRSVTAPRRRYQIGASGWSAPNAGSNAGSTQLMYRCCSYSSRRIRSPAV